MMVVKGPETLFRWHKQHSFTINESILWSLTWLSFDWQSSWQRRYKLDTSIMHFVGVFMFFHVLVKHWLRKHAVISCLFRINAECVLWCSLLRSCCPSQFSSVFLYRVLLLALGLFVALVLHKLSEGRVFREWVCPSNGGDYCCFHFHCFPASLFTFLENCSLKHNKIACNQNCLCHI